MHRLPLLIGGLAATLLCVAPAMAEPETPHAITVSGEGSVSVAPDLAMIDAGVVSDAKTAREASEANSTAMAKVMVALKGAGIAEKDIQTSRLSLQPQYAPNKGGPNAITGYRAANRVTIRLRDVGRIPLTIDTLVSAGANDIGNIGFMVSKASALLDEAREKAVADARRKAEIYAKAAGVTLGVPLSITEEGGAQPAFRPRMAASSIAAASAPPPVSPGEETLSVTVSVSWALK